MSNQQLTVRDLLGILRRRWHLIAATVLVLASLAALYTFTRTPLYRSTSVILLNQESAQDIFDPVNETQGSRFVENEAEFVRSKKVYDAFQDRTGLTNEVSVRPLNYADVLQLSGVSDSPETAAAIANTYANVYLDLRKAKVTDEYNATAQVIQDNIAKIDTDIAESSGQALSRLESRRSDLVTTLSNLSITVDLDGGAGAEFISEAVPADEPFSPNTTRNLGLGILAGMVFGFGLALVADGLDTTVATKEQLEEVSGATNLASIPAISGWRNRNDEMLVSLQDHNSASAEAYRSLRAAIEFAGIDAENKVIQFTSATPGEGKTTTSANLAVALATAGKQVILIDGDLRRPRVHRFFELSPEPGLTSVLIGMAKLGDAHHSVFKDVGELAVIPAGPVPPGPAEVLGSSRFGAVLKRLRTQADYIIIDSAPLLPVADSLVLSQHVDGVILVVNGERSKREQVATAVESLEQVDAKIIGTVLNEAKRSGGTYGYGYGYGYGFDDAQRNGGGRLSRIFRRNSAPAATSLNGADKVGELVKR